jgi:hypothetical protein
LTQRLRCVGSIPDSEAANFDAVTFLPRNIATYPWSPRFFLMREYVFEPSLTLRGGAVVRTLDDAVAFLDKYRDARWPLLRDSTLRRLEGAHDEQEQREAANAFRGWAEFEGVLQV